MAMLHLDGSANGSISLDLHAGGLARPSHFIIHIALFPDSLLILALWPLNQSSAPTPLCTYRYKLFCMLEYVLGRIFMCAQTGIRNADAFSFVPCYPCTKKQHNPIGIHRFKCQISVITMMQVMIGIWLVLYLYQLLKGQGKTIHVQRYALFWTLKAPPLKYLLICSTISSAPNEWNIITSHPHWIEEPFCQYNAVNWKTLMCTLWFESASLKPMLSRWKQIIH